MTKLEIEYAASFYYASVRDSSGKPAGKWSRLKTGINYTCLTSVRNWKTIPQSWKLCGAEKLSRAEVANKYSSFVRMTKLETDYYASFYCVRVRDSSGKPTGK